jgi:hypothetical protein
MVLRSLPRRLSAFHFISSLSLLQKLLPYIVYFPMFPFITAASKETINAPVHLGPFLRGSSWAHSTFPFTESLFHLATAFCIQDGIREQTIFRNSEELMGLGLA